MPGNSALSSNVFTAHIPRPDQFIADGLRYAAQNLQAGWRSAVSYLTNQRPMTDPSPLPHAAVTNVPARTSQGKAKLPQLSQEAARIGEALPGELAKGVELYGATLACTGLLPVSKTPC